MTGVNIIGILDVFKRKQNLKIADMLNGSQPIFSQFGSNIYASDVVQQAISCIVNEMKKLNPTHVRMNGSDPVPVNDNLQKILQKPNKLMTTSEFIEKVTWSLFLNYNSFVIVVREGKEVKSLYPIQPREVSFEKDLKNNLYIRFKFSNGSDFTVPYEDVIHIKYNYSVNDYMGGNSQGRPDHGALLQTLDLNQTLLEGVSKALKSSFQINGVIKYNTIIDHDKMSKNIKKLEKMIQDNESGFLPLDLKGEYIPINRDLELVSDSILEFIDSKILRQFGVPLPILTGDYTKEQYDAFYQKTLEPLITSFGQAFTKAIFTDGELSFNNEVRFLCEELIFMTVDQKLEMIRLLGDSGSMYENEKRVAFGLKPLPELEGVRKQSLNYVDVEIANTYQLDKSQSQNLDGGEANEE